MNFESGEKLGKAMASPTPVLVRIVCGPLK